MSHRHVYSSPFLSAVSYLELAKSDCASRARNDGAEDYIRVSGECAILMARLRFYTVWGPLKHQRIVYVPQSSTLKDTISCSGSFWIIVSCMNW